MGKAKRRRTYKVGKSEKKQKNERLDFKRQLKQLKVVGRVVFKCKLCNTNVRALAKPSWITLSA